MAVEVGQSIFSEVADFLVSQPSLEALAGYHIPSAIQQHLDDLLAKNSEGALGADERLELEKVLAVVRLMDVSKLKAKLKLAEAE
jgi:hypothetical protein